MVGSGIYWEMFLAMFEVRPTDRSDAIGRKAHSGRKKWSKIDVFRRFYEN